jgi:hypothetical protein
VDTQNYNLELPLSSCIFCLLPLFWKEIEVGVWDHWPVSAKSLLLTSECLKQKKNFRGLSPRANYTDRATAAYRRSYCQILRIEEPSGQSERSLRQYTRISRPGPLLFYQVAPQLYSRGWVDPVPDPLLLRKSGRTGNRTRDFWICSQERWPLEHRDWNNLYETLYVFFGTWVHLNGALHKSLLLVCTYVYPLSLLGNGSVKTLPWVQLRSYLEEKVTAPVYKTYIMDVGNPPRWRRDSPLYEKSWH